MQSDGLVTTYLAESDSGPPRKYYRLTPAGRTAVMSQIAEWNSFTGAVTRVLGNAGQSRATQTGGEG
jgi:PadR family transcriptional regulator PadR